MADAPKPKDELTDADYFHTFRQLPDITLGYLVTASPDRTAYSERLQQHAAWIAAEIERVSEDPPCPPQ